MQVNDGISTKSVSVSYTVSDYDKTPPVISGITRNTARTQSSVTIKVTASDNIGVTDYKLDSR